MTNSLAFIKLLAVFAHYAKGLYIIQKRKAPYSSLEKALKILISFVPRNREKSTGEISQEMGLHISTVSRQLKVLTRNGFLQLNPRTKKYSLGKMSLDLGRAVHQSIRDHFVITAQPHIDDLRDLLGKDVALEILVGDATILAYRAWGAQYNKIRYTIGDRLPVHIAAGARAILAFSPTEVVDYFLKGELIRMTPKTITDPNLLKKKLAKYKKEGVAYDLGESDIDFKFVAAPVFNYEKRPVAAVVIGASLHENGKGFEESMISLLKETAAKISYELHYRE